MAKLITLADVDNLATGSAFLGTGGGGDPYIGSLLCKEAIATHGPVQLLGLEDLDDDANVFCAAAMGAPTVMIEKLFSVEEAHRAVSALEDRLGRRATAIISAEIGGLNSVMPVAYAAMRGLPLVDADGMGRAFPSLNMTTFNVYGVSCTPMTIADEHGNVAMLETSSAKEAEDLARPLAAAMGASVSLSCYPMTGRQAKLAALPDTVSAAIAIGTAIRAGEKAISPVNRLLGALRASRYYGHAYRVFEGKIVDLHRDTSSGWVFGRCVIQGLQSSSIAEIGFQNENIAVRVDGVLKAIVPDLICIVDQETALPVTTEALRYGQRVAVIGCSASERLRTPEALACMGPAAFGESAGYVPIETLCGADPAG
ncbi:MAG: DUF917 domain-containing protein [Sphingopyxis sp.]|nr:DUF917 domain-containing protein [Sphingopyxis sp.]